MQKILVMIIQISTPLQLLDIMVDQQKLAVESGHWPLYRYDPHLTANHKNPFQLDSAEPKIPLADYIYTEGRYRMLQKSDPETAKALLLQAQAAVTHRWKHYKQMSQMPGEA